MTLIQQEIIKVANIFLGLREKPGNFGFYDHKGIKQLTGMHPEDFYKTIGWKLGQAWCVYTAEAIWEIAYSRLNSGIIEELEILFSGSAKQTEENFRRSPNFKVDGMVQIGDIAIWRNVNRNGELLIEGHAGIVIDFNSDFIHTIDGNTNGLGGREGIEVAKKRRPYILENIPGTLSLQCFIHPCEP